MVVQVGDAIPDVTLLEGAPDRKVSIAQELSSGKGLIIGVPAAFSPTCTASHIPEYVSHPQLASAGKVFVVSVNDPFVMKAWGESLDSGSKSGIRFLADHDGKFSKALGTTFEAPPAFGDARSKRMAITTENGKVTAVNIEPDNTGMSVSAAGKVLGA